MVSKERIGEILEIVFGIVIIGFIFFSLGFMSGIIIILNHLN